MKFPLRQLSIQWRPCNHHHTKGIGPRRGDLVAYAIAEARCALAAALGSVLTVQIGSQPAELWNASGIEVALVHESLTQPQLRRLWRTRDANRGVPLLLLSTIEGNSEQVLTAGLTQGSLRVGQVDQRALARALTEVRTLPALQAAARLRQALDELQQDGVPGILVHGLLTNHFVRTRLPRSDYRGLLEPAGQAIKQAATWRQRLAAAGYEVAQRDQGYILMAEGLPIAAAQVLADAALFGRMTPSGTLPEGALIRFARESGAHWGLLIGGSRFRLFPARLDRGANTDQWIELDAERLADDWTMALGLIAPVSLRENGLLDRMLIDARDFGAELKERIEEQIREATLPNIAQGLGAWFQATEARDLHEPVVRDELQRATMTFLFRMLFLFYTESAGFLPIDSKSYRPHSLTQLAHEALQARDRVDPQSTSFWDRLRTLVRAVRTGNSAWEMPAYDGQLFAADDLPGSELLERAEVSDAYVVPALIALGFDTSEIEEAVGIDYAGMEVGHIGSIYESLLGLQLSLADAPLAWDAKSKRYVPARRDTDAVIPRQTLFFQSEAGGRKAGGVFYTRQEFVRHLVQHSVTPALTEHLDMVRELAISDPAGAAEQLFEFRVLDPAMGSGHFLVDAMDVIADRIQTFLAETPLPKVRDILAELRQGAGEQANEIEDGALLRRIVLKRCVYGVDLSEMAVELARVALWLHSFVPGLALTYLNHNLQRGNSLIGIASIEQTVAQTNPMIRLPNFPVLPALRESAQLSAQLARVQDRSPNEVRASRDLERQVRSAQAGVKRVFDLWTAEPLGVSGAREAIITEGPQIIADQPSNRVAALVARAEQLASDFSFFHWPLAFPEVFDPTGTAPGFDAVVGNPPWDEVTVEELGFYALHDPGLRGLTSEGERAERIASLQQRYPRLKPELERRRAEAKELRRFFGPQGGYALQGGGDTDLYQLFCERYTALTRTSGYLSVVLPRSTFLVDGARGFRRWLFRRSTLTRLDFVLNRKRWAFDIHPQYTIALMAARRDAPKPDALLRTTGPSDSAGAFEQARHSSGVPIPLAQLRTWSPAPAGDTNTEPSWEIPLLPSPEMEPLLNKLRAHQRFDQWAKSVGGVIAVTEFHETQQKKLYRYPEGTPVWKGASFDQYAPHGDEIAGYANWPEAFAFVQKKRLSPQSTFRRWFQRSTLEDPKTHPIWRARLAFRDVSRATDSRTARAAIVPPKTFLTNKAPYFVFPQRDAILETYTLGVLNSLPFDWQARRYIETNLNYYILDLLSVPAGELSDVEAIARRAGRLSAVDWRFAHYAHELGVECGPLSDQEHAVLRAEIDALVAHAYGLSANDLDVIFRDFTERAVPNDYRALVRAKYQELGSAT